MNAANSFPRILRIDSRLGGITLAASDAGLCGVWFEDQKYFPDLHDWPEAPDDALLREAERQLGAYFAGERHVFDLPLDTSRGTPFQREVWAALCKVKYGCTISYGALATALGRPSAVRAVGAAVGRNPVSVIVPCHRVLGSDGSLTGYAGGVGRKVALLELEDAASIRQPQPAS